MQLDKIKNKQTIIIKKFIKITTATKRQKLTTTKIDKWESKWMNKWINGQMDEWMDDYQNSN